MVSTGLSALSALTKNRINLPLHKNISKLRYLYFNARSLKPKLAELHDILYSMEYDVIGVSETWLNCQTSDGSMDPNIKCKIYRKDRNSSKVG